MVRKLVTVDRSRFFEALFRDPRNIHPHLSGERWDPGHGYVTEWKDLRSGALFGRSWGSGAQTYQLAEDVGAEKRSD